MQDRELLIWLWDKLRWQSSWKDEKMLRFSCQYWLKLSYCQRLESMSCDTRLVLLLQRTLSHKQQSLSPRAHVRGEVKLERTRDDLSSDSASYSSSRHPKQTKRPFWIEINETHNSTTRAQKPPEETLKCPIFEWNGAHCKHTLCLAFYTSMAP